MKKMGRRAMDKTRSKKAACNPPSGKKRPPAAKMKQTAPTKQVAKAQCAPKTRTSEQTKPGAAAKVVSDDRFVRAMKEIPKGEVWSFQELAVAAERQGQGGMMRASSVAHSIVSTARNIPWWRVVYKPKTGKALRGYLQKGSSRATVQAQLLQAEKVDVNKEWVEKPLAPDDQLTLRAKDLKALKGRSSSITTLSGSSRSKSSAFSSLFNDWEMRVDKIATTIAEKLGREGIFATTKSSVKAGAPAPQGSSTHRALSSTSAVSSSSSSDWEPIRVGNVFSAEEVGAILDWAAEDVYHHRTVRLEKHNFGKGVYHYLAESAFVKDAKHNYVGSSLSLFRERLFETLLPFAARLSSGSSTELKQLAGNSSTCAGMKKQHAGTTSASSTTALSPLKKFHRLCEKKGQARPSSLILYYRAGGVNFAHRDLFGSIAFPFQVLALLSSPKDDFEGGQFFTKTAKGVCTTHELQMGDVLVFDPIKVTHGMTKITKGRRAVFGFVFHLAK
ncbi:unnamed protein product [Amoebophrya sp. A120]|nr:unnamed protein product [Amoebophrya sp. A120]|eukprot:GSA120T00010853001.1